MIHQFHIPVLGLSFSIDSALKVAKYGIASVLSIVDDELIERVRRYYAAQNDYPVCPIDKKEQDYRAKRITSYLNLVHQLVNKQVEDLKQQTFAKGTDLTKYFELLAPSSPLALKYQAMLRCSNRAEKTAMQQELRDAVVPGAIDVNIMSKLDKANFDRLGERLDDTYTDASAGLRGFANSTLNSSVVLSAGMNPRLYAYLAEREEFMPNEEGLLNKKVTLKVSDFRSSLIQAKYLAKKGVWVSEFRVESGLNCGGHAFATDGYLLGPILEEFKQKKAELIAELSTIYLDALSKKAVHIEAVPPIRFTVQGGVGTAEEQKILLDYYGFDAVGWGSPFLLVPEATTVDEATLKALADSREEDFYVSNSSPLGVLFNNFRKAAAETKRVERIVRNRPGSPCVKKYLVSNTEFTTEPICTASREYQNLKLKQLDEMKLPADEYRDKFKEITDKTCLCEGLAASAYIKYDIAKRKENTSVSICPGPNTAYFNETYSLKQMVDHIYGRSTIQVAFHRPHMFINELQLYIEHLERYMSKKIKDEKYLKFADKFRNQLFDGIKYYNNMCDTLTSYQGFSKEAFLRALKEKKEKLEQTITVLSNPTALAN